MDSRKPFAYLKIGPIAGQIETERRRKARYGFVTPLMYKLQRDTQWSGSGRSVNMNADGILMSADRSFAPGSRVALSLDWPGLYHDAARIRLVVTAIVVRSEGQLTALRILEHEFVKIQTVPRIRRIGVAVRRDRSEVA